MNDFDYIYYSLKSRWLNCMLSILLTAFGVSVAILIIQFSDNVRDRINNDGKGVDIIIGAKGSPLQIVLSSLYHIDVPTGNISLEAARKFINHPQVKQAIPLALGDSWKGKRIVGTTKSYLSHYKAKIKKGKIWHKEYEVVIGSSIDLKLNEEFIGSHGLTDSGKEHDEHKYKVVGILKPTGTVLDKLILTNLNSVLEIHQHEKVNLKSFDKSKLNKKDISHQNNNKHESHSKHNHNDHNKHESNGDDSHEHKSHNEHSHLNNKDKKKTNISTEITALLLITKTPIANINLPLIINKETSMQAANPAKEITRLSQMLGVGSKSLSLFSAILICFAALSVFSGLAANLENRMGDLAVLRAIGYSKKRIFKIICFEGIFIALIGVFIGIAMGLLIFHFMALTFNTLSVVQTSFIISTKIFYVSVIVVFTGFLAALFPAYTFSKISVANQLTRNI